MFLGLANDHRIELIHYVDPPSAEGSLDRHQLGSMHICFDVGDLAATHEQLRARSVRFLTVPKFRDVAGKIIGVVYARDPEGNWLKFVECFETAATN